ncbi:hypothetical protein P4O66_012580, partial [Electrophorus voltai]
NSCKSPAHFKMFISSEPITSVILTLQRSHVATSWQLRQLDSHFGETVDQFININIVYYFTMLHYSKLRGSQGNALQLTGQAWVHFEDYKRGSAATALPYQSILILDEVRAAMDLETYSLIQSANRNGFAHCTMFTHTILDSSWMALTLLQGTNAVCYMIASKHIET